MYETTYEVSRYAMMTTCLGGTDCGFKADDTHQFVDANSPLGIPEFFESIGAGHATGFKGTSGQYTYPLFEFSDEFLAECGDNRWGHLVALIKLI